MDSDKNKASKSSTDDNSSIESSKNYKNSPRRRSNRYSSRRYKDKTPRTDPTAYNPHSDNDSEDPEELDVNADCTNDSNDDANMRPSYDNNQTEHTDMDVKDTTAQHNQSTDAAARPAATDNKGPESCDPSATVATTGNLPTGSQPSSPPGVRGHA